MDTAAAQEDEYLNELDALRKAVAELDTMHEGSNEQVNAVRSIYDGPAFRAASIGRRLIWSRAKANRP